MPRGLTTSDSVDSIIIYWGFWGMYNAHNVCTPLCVIHIGYLGQ